MPRKSKLNATAPAAKPPEKAPETPKKAKAPKANVPVPNNYKSSEDARLENEAAEKAKEKNKEKSPG